jgi:hypothetical protein
MLLVVNRPLAVAAIALASAGSLTGIASATPHKTATSNASLIKAVKVTPNLVGGNGGTAAVTATLDAATTCQLVVISHPLFKVYVPKPQPCKTTVTAYVKLGANPTAVKRAVAIDLVVTSGKYESKSLLYISIAPKPVPPPVTTTTTVGATTTTTAPAVVIGGGGGSSPPAPTTTTTVASTSTTTVAPTTTTTVAPTTTTTVAPTTTTTVAPTTTTTTPSSPVITPAASNNWSGYAIQGSQPYTAVSGTFTVPALTYASSCDDAMSEWVGIDGLSNSSLIQAGVSEVTTWEGQCTPGQYYLLPWWEVLPADETPILEWNDGTPATVEVGDHITVIIEQNSGTTWAIQLTDDRNGETFSTDVSYDGPGASAEWIVEDTDQPANPDCPNTTGLYLCPMPAYDPAVSYTGLGASPGNNVTDWYQISLEDQNGNVVSAPSALSDNADFSVSYTGTGTNAPLGRLVRTAGSKAPLVVGPLPVSVGPHLVSSADR